MDLLEIKNLKMHFPIKKGLFSKTRGFVKAVNGVSFNLKKGETLGLVGESGCGKTTVARSLLRLIEPTGGSVNFEGVDILQLPKKELRKIRAHIQVIFQDPYSSLNPRLSVGQIIAEPLKNFESRPTEQLKERVAYLMKKVGLNPHQTGRYPHQYSGGQRQRIGIARALALNPKIIVCDEAVSALDVSIQAQVLNLLMALQAELGLAYIFIAHDLSVVEHISDRVAVMYLGKIVEMATDYDIYHNPRHPYTQALLSAVPVPDPGAHKKRILLKGDVPSPLNPPSGCAFHTRCPKKETVCTREQPVFASLGNEHWAACHFC
jgi:oligopeptide/dipeptide ABC transporter ATP-binding protein